MYDNQRQNFIKNMTKIAKDLEEITLLDASEADIKRENGNIDGNSSMGMMLHYGSTVGKQFAKDYIMSPKFTELHNKGYIHIHDMDFVPEGTTTCMQINLEKLFEKGFSTGHGYLRTPGSIMSYAALTAVAIQASQNDFHGGQGIPFFDTYLAPGVLKTFRKEFYKTLSIIYGGNPEDVTKEEIFNHIDTIDLEKSRFGKWLFETLPEKLGSPINPRMMSYVYQVAKAETDKQTYQAMESLIHNLNTMHSRAGAQVPFSSINFGTDITPEGRMVTKNYLLAADAGLGHGETPIFPISIFRMQTGINYNPEDPNYDLFKLAMKVSAKRLFPNFSNQDATYNKQFLDPNNKDTQIAYMGCRTRVLANVNGPSTTPHRGNLSFTTINLPRLALESKGDIDLFYSKLYVMLTNVRDQLLERFEWQCHKRKRNFPIAMEQGEWMDADKLGEEEDLYESLKHGTLSIGFIGLAETLKCLLGKHHGESEKAQDIGLEIVSYMRKICDKFCKETQLNFSLLATPAEGLSGRFLNIDKGIYGVIEGITDKDWYTNSFHVPVEYSITAIGKIRKEAPYHELCNAGHITYVEMDGDPLRNLEAFEAIVRLMHDYNIGYGAINHPVDMCTCCSYTGIIGDKCPQCYRTEDEWPSYQRIQELIKQGFLIPKETIDNAKRD
jgi:ribonucleoside-triphosphate reductase (formate)